MVQPRRRRRTARAAASRPARPCPLLCQRKPATTQSAVRACLTLIIARLPGWYVPSLGLGDHAVEAGAFEARRATRRRRARSRVIGVRWIGGSTLAEQPLEPRAALALRRRAQVARRRPRAGRTRRTTPASPSRASRRATPPDAAAAAARRSRARAAWRSRSRRRRTQPAGSRVEKRVVQLGKVAIERPQVAALDEHVRSPPRKTIARKPSHFGSYRERRRRREARRRAWRASARSAVRLRTQSPSRRLYVETTGVRQRHTRKARRQRPRLGTTQFASHSPSLSR